VCGSFGFSVDRVFDNRRPELEIDVSAFFMQRKKVAVICVLHNLAVTSARN